MRGTLLALHLMLVALGTGMSFANLVNLRLADSETGDRFAVLGLLRRRLARVADVVIALLWVTGIALAWMLLAAGAEIWSPWFALKLLFVVALTGCHALVRTTAARMARTGDRTLLSSLQVCVAGVFGSALAAIALAVAAFG